MGNNTSVLDCVNDDMDLDESLIIAMLNQEANDEHELKSFITLINDLEDVDEDISGELKKKEVPQGIRTFGT